MQKIRLAAKSWLFVTFMALGGVLAFVPASPALANHCGPNEQTLSIAITDASGNSVHCVSKTSTTVQDNPIVAFLRTVLQFLIAGIGIALVGGLTVGGLVYMTARGNAQQVQKAEEIIRNVIIGIALYVFAFAIINFIIPGGILQTN